MEIGELCCLGIAEENSYMNTSGDMEDLNFEIQMFHQRIRHHHTTIQNPILERT